jgi:molecular chaperone GrpE
MPQKESKKVQELENTIGELTADLQRIQADFVNYRRRMEEDRAQLVQTTKAATIMKLLPMIDNIERALNHLPAELQDDTWVKGVVSLQKSLEKSLQDLGVTRIEALHQPFNPELHEAISMEDGDGEQEVVIEELRAGYKLGDVVVRPTMVRVGHK